MNPDQGVRNGLPRGWVACSIGQVTLPVSKVDPKESPDEEIDYIDISSIDNAKQIIGDVRRLRLKEAPSRARQIVRSGDVLFATVRPYLRNIASVPKQLDRQIASTGFSVLRPATGISPAFLYYKAISQEFVNALSGMQYGVSYPAVKDEQVRDQPLWLPPFKEQRRIVAKIDELFSELDKGIESLKTTRAQIKVYRQAVLKHAFEGKLTARWREANKDKLETSEQLLLLISRERDARCEQRLKKWKTALKKWEESGKFGKKPQRPRKAKPLSMLDVEKLNHSGALPKGWLWLTAESIGIVQLGRQRSPKNRSKHFPTKYVRAANITEQGLDLDDILDMDFLPHELSAYRLKKGDLLLTEASGSAAKVGRPAIWADQIPNCCFQNTVIRHQPYCRDFAHFLLWLYRYFYLSGKFAQVAGGVGINHLSASRFAQIPLPLCSVAEQLEIVSLLKERFVAIEQAEREVESTLRRTEKLRQAVLKKAFSGQLVAQDSKDEPASTLLERIKAENASPEQRTKTRRRKAVNA